MHARTDTLLILPSPFLPGWLALQLTVPACLSAWCRTSEIVERLQEGEEPVEQTVAGMTSRKDRSYKAIDVLLSSSSFPLDPSCTSSFKGTEQTVKILFEGMQGESFPWLCKRSSVIRNEVDLLFQLLVSLSSLSSASPIPSTSLTDKRPADHQLPLESVGRRFSDLVSPLVPLPCCVYMAASQLPTCALYRFRCSRMTKVKLRSLAKSCASARRFCFSHALSPRE